MSGFPIKTSFRYLPLNASELWNFLNQFSQQRASRLLRKRRVPAHE